MAVPNASTDTTHIGVHRADPELAVKMRVLDAAPEHAKLPAQDAVAAHFIAHAAKIERGQKRPHFIEYAGKRYYSADAKSAIRSAIPGTPAAKALAVHLEVATLPKAHEVQTYGSYRPGGPGNDRLTGKLYAIAKRIARNPESMHDADSRNAAIGALQEFNKEYLAPLHITGKLNNHYKDSGLDDAILRAIKPIGDFYQQQNAPVTKPAPPINPAPTTPIAKPPLHLAGAFLQLRAPVPVPPAFGTPRRVRLGVIRRSK